MTTITEPGVYTIPPSQYHADPVPEGSLSSSGARKLLPPSCPARFKYERDHPAQPTEAMEFGTVAHKIVLGEGDEVVVVDADSWRTKAAKEERDEARMAGKIPLLPHEYQQAEQMAEVIRSHPVASALFSKGTPEQSLFWIDDRTGIWRRARIDWLPEPRDGRLIVPDYKTARAVDPDSLARAVDTYGFDQQCAWYLDGIKALGLDDDPAFVLVFQEKTEPYLVTVAELDSTALKRGAVRNRRAIDVYKHCVEHDEWPSYDRGDVALLSLPAWAENQFVGEMSA